MKAVIPFNTQNYNYLYFYNNKVLTISHPVLCEMIEIFNAKNFDTPKQLEPYLKTLEEKYKKRNVDYYFNLLMTFYKAGYLDNTSFEGKFLSRIENNDLNKLISNVKQVTFEVTEKCNLQCEYCGYGDLYDGYSPRKRENLPSNYAIKLLDYLSEFWNSDENTSHDRITYISFYGGEPLLNFKFIEDIVQYSNKLNLKHNKIVFSMTTNAVLLKKHIKFLVKHNFHILISIDGNSKNHSYRKFQDGTNSHQIVVENIRYIQDNYPDFFDRRISFNAVLHNRNSIDEITDYIEKTFGKIPAIGELSTSGISKDNQKKFWETYNNFTECLHESDNYESLSEKLFMIIPKGKYLTNFLMKGIYYNKDDYNDLIYDKHKIFSPTGTCAPFSKKIFVTAQGKLLACEKIEHKYALGKVTNSGVDINFSKIKDLYNINYDKMYNLCSKCYISANCVQCMFFLDLNKEKITCNGFTGYENYRILLQNIMTYLEDHPEKKHEIQRKYVFSF